MNSNLALAFLAKGVIRRGTVLQAYQNVKSLSCACDSRVIGSFTVNRARLNRHEQVIFDTIDVDHGPCILPAEQVIMVDGMRLERLAGSHRLSVEGIDIVKSSRRKRKSALKTIDASLPV
jgi:hypothetical protein